MSEKGQANYVQRTNLNLPVNMSNNQRPVTQQSTANNVPGGSGRPIPVTNPLSMAQLADTHYIVAEEFTLGVPMVRPKQNFHSILKEGGATGEVFTKKEVCNFLKEYISNRQLFDPKDPRVVFCKDDPLGKVFNCKKFTITDAMKLIDANCYQLPDTCIKRKQHLVARPKTSTATGAMYSENQVITTVAGPSSVRIQVCSPSPIVTSSSGIQSTPSTSHGITETTTSKNAKKKRKREGRHVSDDSSSSSGRRRQASVSINISDNESSSYPWYFSVQMDSETDPEKKEADKEDEDEDVIAVEVESDRIAVEYEVASDDDDIISSTASISGLSENNVFIICGDSDMEFWADSSDTELSDGDKWSCLECKTQNSALHGYCIKCWKMRPGWLPEKEAQRKRRLEMTDSKNKEVVSSSESSDISQPKQKARRRNRTISTELESEKEITLEENDSGMGTFSSQQSSQDSIIQTDTSKEEENLISSENSFVPSLMQNSPTLETYRTLLNYQSSKSSISKKQTSVESSGSLISPQNIINRACSPLGQNSDNRSLSHISADTADSNLKNDTSESLAVFPTADVSSNPEQKSSLCSTSSTAVVSGNLEENRSSSTTSQSIDVEDYCVICLKRPKTGSIIHGCTGHQVCCFRCARRLKRRGRPCPVCRRPIQKVIRNFIL